MLPTHPRDSRSTGLRFRLAAILVLLAAVVTTVAVFGVVPGMQGILSNASADRNANGHDGPGDVGGTIAPTKPEPTPTERPYATVACEPSPEADVTLEPEPTETAEPTEPTEPTEAPEPTKAPVRTAPVLAAIVADGQVRLSWTAAKGEGLRGYKVVASATDETPSYPDDGYYFWITDLSKRTARVDSTTCYNGGDFDGAMTPGSSYWFAITALYEDGSATSNAVKVTCPEPPPPPPTPAAPTVEVVANAGEVVLEWTVPADARLVGFKVVASLADEHPAYPDDGYTQWIPDPDCRRAVVRAGDCYYGGDLAGVFEPGVAYWFSITAIYEIDGEWVKVPGNAVKVVLPDKPAE